MFGDTAQSAQNSGASGNASATFPGATTAGNLLLFGVARSASHTSGGAWGTPSEFTLIEDSGIQSGNMGAAWWWKIAEGDEAAISVAGTNEAGNWRAVVIEIEGPFHASTPFDQSEENADNLSTVVASQSTGTTGTTVQANAIALAFFGFDQAAAVDGGRGYNNSFVEVIFADIVSSAARAGIAVAKRVLVATGAYSCTYTTTDPGDEAYGSIAVFRGEVTGTPPTVVLDTADETIFNTGVPTLEFTGTDGEGDAITYQIQISNNANFAGGGVNLTFEHVAGSGVVHPNPTGGLVNNGTSADGNPQVDDRPGETIVWGGGILDHINVLIGRDETDTDGIALVRAYDIDGTPGTDAEPAGATIGDDTPTAGWLAESDGVALDNTLPETPDWIQFDYSGDQRIQTVSNEVQMLIVEWIPAATAPSSNTITIQVGNVEAGHNGWVDGDSANYGVQAFGPKIRVYELQTLLDKASDSDAGFANTENGGDTDPFTSGETVSYTVQDADELSNGVYYWRVRGSDPDGSGSFGAWTAARTFTVNTDEDTPDIPGDIPTGELDRLPAGGVAIPVVLVEASDLNGVQHLLQSKVAIPVYESERKVEGGAAVLAYAVSQELVDSGQFSIAGGATIPIVIVGRYRGVIGGAVTPIFIGD